MYKSDTSAVVVRGARFMPCTLTDEDSGKTIKINVKEPKLKVYKKFTEINEASDVDDIAAVAAAILSCNKENVKITADYVLDNFAIDEIAQFFEDFASWISEARRTDPN